MNELVCSPAPIGLIALWGAFLVFLIPAIRFVRRRLRASYRKLGMQVSRTMAWTYLWRVDLPWAVGQAGPLERALLMAVAGVLMLAIVGLPIALLTAALATNCP